MHKNKAELKKKVKDRIRKRVRGKIRGTPERPRLYVFKSNRYIYAQAINDENGTILASACSQEKSIKEQTKNQKNKEASQKLGEVLAGKLKEKRIEKIVFDRGIYPYHGRIKALAEALRKGGIVF